MRDQLTVEKIYQYLNTVKDPEVPAISVVELGVVRNVHLDQDSVRIDITPTYSGCPAMKVMESEILTTLRNRGIDNVEIKTVLFPPWSTEDMSAEARQKLKEYGIAPPGDLQPSDLDPFDRSEKKVNCPFCDSGTTSLTSQFGSTACKALYYCQSCQQPFEHFKCI